MLLYYRVIIVLYNIKKLLLILHYKLILLQSAELLIIDIMFINHR